jgi:hypothetical protein
MARGMKAARYVRFWGQQHAGMYIKQMWLGAGVRTCGVGKSSNGRAAMLSLLQKLGEGYRHLCMYRCTVGNPELFPWNKPGPHPCASAMGSCGICVAPLSGYWMSRVEGRSERPGDTAADRPSGFARL